MAKKVSEKESLKTEATKQRSENTRIKMFIQALDIRQDTNMTRVYSALQSIKNQQA